MDQQSNVKIAKAFAVIIGATAILVMIGWAFNIGFLKSISPSWIAMRFMTAIVFLLTAFILYYIAEDMEEGETTGIAGVVLPLASFFSAILMLSLIYFDISGVRIGLEDLLVMKTGDTTAPTRPAVPAIFNFILVAISGIVTVFHPSNLKTILSWLGGIVAAVGAIACTGYLLNVQLLYYSIAGPDTAMALHTSFLFVLFGAGLLLLCRGEEAAPSRPDRKSMASDMKSPARLLATLMFVLFVIEMTTMVVFTLLPPMPAWQETLIDATIIVTLFFPFLYFLVFRPFKMRDMQQTLAQQQIEQSRQEWVATFDAVGDPIFLHDAKFHIVRANRAYAERAGKPFHELIGQPYWQVFPKSDGPLPSCLNALHGKEDEGEEEISCASGEICTSRSFVMRNQQGAYQSSIHIIRDITAQKRMQLALRESEEKFRQISVTANDAILMMDNVCKVSFWNAAAERIFGYSSEEALGMELHHLIVPPRFHGDFAAGFSAFQDTGQGPLIGKTRELQGMRKDGVEIPVELSVSAVRLHDQWHAIGIMRDITERKLAEDQVKAQLEDIARMNTKLTEANKQLGQAQSQLLQSEKMASIGQLAAGVAHEINNPIGYVNSNLGTLEKYVTGLCKVIAAYEQAEAVAGAQASSEVDEIKRAIDLPYLMDDIPNLLRESQDGLARVKRIIQDLSNFSRMDESAWQFASLEHGMDSTLNVVWNEIKYKANVVKEYAGLPEVECMPSQVNQVFLNLLVNAAHAIEEKGTITIRTGMQGDEVWVEVEDTGKGIPAENLTRIFDPFFTTKPVGQGTGLGLSVSYGIVQKHGGHIEVNSTVGKGTTMRVWLPLQHAAEAHI